MTLRPTQPVKLQWDKGPSGTKSYDILLNGKKVASTKTGLSTQITLASDDDVKIVAQPSGLAQEMKITWMTIAPPPPPGSNPVPPPASGVYLGAYIEGETTFGTYYPSEAPWGNAPNDGRTWDRFERDAGKKIVLMMYGQPNFFSGGSFDPDGKLAATIARGAIPVIDVMTSQTGTLVDFAAGKYDAGITAAANGLKAVGKPIVLRIDAEMNGGWYPFGQEIRATPQGPANFIAAWRRIHDLFKTAGATNVSFHWCPNVDPESIQTPLENLYPGDAYVDWTGMTGYNAGGEAVSWLFDATYARLVAVAPSRPIMIGETGSVDVGHPGEKVNYMQTFFPALSASYPKVRAFCWFNWLSSDGDWPIESSADGQAAFSAAVASSYIVGR